MLWAPSPSSGPWNHPNLNPLYSAPANKTRLLPEYAKMEILVGLSSIYRLRYKHNIYVMHWGKHVSEALNSTHICQSMTGKDMLNAYAYAYAYKFKAFSCFIQPWSRTFHAAALSVSSTIFNMHFVHRNGIFTTVKQCD